MQNARRNCQGRLRSDLGAQSLKRASQIEIEPENALAKEFLSGRFAPKDTIRVDAQGGCSASGSGSTAGLIGLAVDAADIALFWERAIF